MKNKIKEKIDELEENVIIKEPIVKITFKRLLAYFVIYSFLGFIIETIYGMITKGVLESRRSCLFGPFCCIYGLGAAIMIPGLQKFKKSNWGIFIAGAIEGSVIEYLISWIGEVIFQIKWWDYSNMPFNINGRITLQYSIFWGLLALILIRFINPYVERVINKVPQRWSNILTISITIFLLFDIIITFVGLKVFYTGLINEYDLQIKGENELILSDEFVNNNTIQFLSSNIFSEEKILKTFPNIKFEDKDGNIVWIKDILVDIQPYYFKISDKFRLK